jgi:hypothetical protein
LVVEWDGDLIFLLCFYFSSRYSYLVFYSTYFRGKKDNPTLDNIALGKKLKGKRKASGSETLIAILQERFAFEDERNEANFKVEEERECKRQRIVSEKDERWFGSLYLLSLYMNY